MVISAVFALSAFESLRSLIATAPLPLEAAQSEKRETYRWNLRRAPKQSDVARMRPSRREAAFLVVTHTIDSYALRPECLVRTPEAAAGHARVTRVRP